MLVLIIYFKETFEIIWKKYIYIMRHLYLENENKLNDYRVIPRITRKVSKMKNSCQMCKFIVTWQLIQTKQDFHANNNAKQQFIYLICTLHPPCRWIPQEREFCWVSNNERNFSLRGLAFLLLPSIPFQPTCLQTVANSIPRNASPPNATRMLDEDVCSLARTIGRMESSWNGRVVRVDTSQTFFERFEQR